jgi:hypothetical protein
VTLLVDTLTLALMPILNWMYANPAYPQWDVMITAFKKAITDDVFQDVVRIFNLPEGGLALFMATDRNGYKHVLHLALHAIVDYKLMMLSGGYGNAYGNTPDIPGWVTQRIQIAQFLALNLTPEFVDLQLSSY